MPDSIGIITRLHGDATATAQDGTVRSLALGDPVFEDDTVAVGGGQSALEIRFTDDTLFSQGHDSIVVLDRYLFDPETGNGHLLFEMVEGTFRSVTGRIVDTHPENFELQSPLATVGIRGTSTGHTIPGGGQPEEHVVLVFDGKPVVVTPFGAGDVRFMDLGGAQVEVSQHATTDVRGMTRAEYAYYQQFSSRNLDLGAPLYNSPEEIAEEHPELNAPVTDQEVGDAQQADQEAQQARFGPEDGQEAGQEGEDGNEADENEADENGADENSGDGASDGEDSGEDSGEETGDSGEDSDDTDDLVAADSESEGSLTLTGSTGTDDLSGSGDGSLGGTDSGSSLGTSDSGSSSAAALGLYSSSATTGTDDDLIETPTTTTEPGLSYITVATSSSGTYDLSDASGYDVVTLSDPSPAGSVEVNAAANLMNDGATLTVDATGFTGTSSLDFDGTAENEGYFKVLGSDNDDSITGTNHNTNGDVLYGYGGEDKLVGEKGLDTIYGGDDDDNISGGLDKDALYGEAGDDTFGFGYDDVEAGEIIDGGSGTDTIEVENTVDFSDASITSIEKLAAHVNGTDATFGTNVSGMITSISGDADQNNTDTFTFKGTSGADTLDLSTVTSITTWSAGTDSITITGEGGNDTLTAFSVSGVSCTLKGGDGADTLIGGSQDDLFHYDYDTAESGESVDGNGGTDTIKVVNTNDFRGTTFSDIEKLTLEDSAVTFDQNISGKTWTVDGSTGDSQLKIDVDDTGRTVDLSGLNMSNWSSDSVSMYGGTGADSLTGTSEADTIEGGNGNDTLVGGSGNDTLEGECGEDTLTGGSGNDIFRYDSKYDGDDTITDFVSGTDKIQCDDSGFAMNGTVYGTDWEFTTVSSLDSGGGHGSSNTPIFVYCTGDDTLYYDYNGNESGGVETIAEVQGNAVAQTDISVV